MNQRPNHTIRAESAELSILALVLRHPDTLAEAQSLMLRAGAFQSMYNRAIWTGFVQDAQADWMPDEVTLRERWAPTVGKPGNPFQTGAALDGWVRGIKGRAAHRRNLGQYIEAVLTTHRARQILDSANVLLGTGAAGDGLETARAVIAEADGLATLTGLPLRAETSQIRTMEDIVSVYAHEQLAIRRGEMVDTRIRMGISALDRRWRFGPGEIGVMAGRPGMGKTQALLTFLRNVARLDGGSGMCSIEMGAPALARRAMSSAVKESAALVEYEHGVARVLSEWSHDRTPVYIDSTSTTLDDVLRSVRVMAVKHGCRFVGVDYLQRIRLPSAAREDIAISAAVNAFAALAKELGIFVLLLAQLNRSVEKREDKHPGIYDLKGASGIEDAADWIVLMYRDAYYEAMSGGTPAEPHIVEMMFGKARFGGVGRALLSWTPGDGYLYDAADRTFE